MPAYDEINNHAHWTVTSEETCKRENNIQWNDKRYNDFKSISI